MNKLILKTSVLSLSALFLAACGQTKKEQPAEDEWQSCISWMVCRSGRNRLW